jgi:hypothetical protein
MQQSFGQFIITNFTLSVFVSVIVYKIFSILLDDLLSPCVYMLVDPNSELPLRKIDLGAYTIEYGKSLRDLTVSIIILLVVYYFFNIK